VQQKHFPRASEAKNAPARPTEGRPQITPMTANPSDLSTDIHEVHGRLEHRSEPGKERNDLPARSSGARDKSPAPMVAGKRKIHPIEPTAASPDSLSLRSAFSAVQFRIRFAPLRVICGRLA